LTDLKECPKKLIKYIDGPKILTDQKCFSFFPKRAVGGKSLSSLSESMKKDPSQPTPQPLSWGVVFEEITRYSITCFICPS
jgi:hypothetical protein